MLWVQVGGVVADGWGVVVVSVGRGGPHPVPVGGRGAAEERPEPAAGHHGRRRAAARESCHLRVEQLRPLDLRQDSGRKRASTQRRVCYVEEGVWREALGERRGISVRNRGTNVNRRGVMYLMV